MAPRKPKEVDSQGLVVANTPPVAVAPRQDLVLQGDPEKQIEFAQKAASALMKVVKPVEIQGKPYLQFGGWQTLARFFGATVAIEWTSKLIDDKDKLVGYEARAIVYQQGNIISSAEASCMTTEKRWKTAEEFAIKSMAQTRASAKALRNAFGWVAELAQDPRTGQRLQSTPAEEMQYDRSEVPDNARVTSTATSTDTSADTSAEEYNNQTRVELICADTNVSISQAEYDYSVKFYGKPLCRAAQKNNNKIR